MSLIPLEEAQAHVWGSCGLLAPRSLPLEGALGCVTSAPVSAREDVPPFANTAMDGYAVRSADTGEGCASLEVVGTLAAGAAPDIEVGRGQAVRIMTGAPMPPGADAVIMVERTRLVEGGRRVAVGEVQAGENVRGAGEDLASGQLVFGEGTLLGPGHIGVLASLGMSEVEAYPRPRVGVLSTGDELAEGGRPMRHGQIRDANRPALLALVGQAGFEALDLGIAGDTEDEITRAMEKGLAETDAILTSGGVSVGDFDYVKVVLDQLSGGGMRWMQVAIKPAKPLAFGNVGNRPVFGLPGNPVSSMVSFELFARPALRKMMGRSDTRRRHVDAVCDEALRRPRDGKLHFVRVAATTDASGRYRVRPSGGQGSHMLWSMALANALAVVPDGEGLEAGATVTTMLLE